jgi:hypothetical protein
MELLKKKEIKIRAKEEELDRLKKQLIQFKSTEVSVPEDNNQDDTVNQEETLSCAI